jgi:hypothetical protein
MDPRSQTIKEEHGPKDKIAILLKEYDSLRGETVSRTTNCYQLWAAAGAAMAWITSRPIDWRLWILAITLALIFLGVFGALYRDINGLCERVSVIESKVNALAGEELLEWETRWGGFANGWFCWKRSRKSN